MKALKIAKRVFLGLMLTASSALGLDFGVRQAANKTIPLPENYIETAQTIFGNTVDYAKVRITFGKVSCLQPDKAVTIGNTIYYPSSKTPAPDYSFLHEMTHVWQQQNHIKDTGLPGVIKLWAKYPSYKDSYAFKADSTKALTDYNLEQQASIVANYWIFKGAMDKDPKHPPNAEYETLKKIVGKTLPAPPKPGKP